MFHGGLAQGKGKIVISEIIAHLNRDSKHLSKTDIYVRVLPRVGGSGRVSG